MKATTAAARPGSKDGYRIGEVAELAQVSERALRYYEEVGLLQPAHEVGSIRFYRDNDVERVRRIRQLQELLGFNLEEIKKVMAAEDRLDALRLECRTSSSPRQELRREAIDTLLDLRGQVDAKQARLAEFGENLDAKLARFEELVAHRTGP